VLSHHHRSSTRTQQAGKVRERVGMMDVNDIGPLPCGRDVSRVTPERCRPDSPARPRLSTATTSTWWPRLAAPSASVWTTRSMPPDRGQ
jgi:hypothetical protein